MYIVNVVVYSRHTRGMGSACIRSYHYMSQHDRESLTHPSDRDDALLFSPTRAFSPTDSVPAIVDDVGPFARRNVETLARSPGPDDHRALDRLPDAATRLPTPTSRTVALTALPLEPYTPGTAAGQALSASAIPTPMLTTLSGTPAQTVPWSPFQPPTTDPRPLAPDLAEGTDAPTDPAEAEVEDPDITDAVAADVELEVLPDECDSALGELEAEVPLTADPGSGGSGGGGSPIPDPLPVPTPAVTQADPAAALGALGPLPPLQLQAALPGAFAAATNFVATQRAALAATPPQLPRPAGAAATRTAAETHSAPPSDDRATIERVPDGTPLPVAAPEPL